jgi:hypothetical protein
MKWLKVFTEERLSGDNHITFAYFGTEYVNKQLVRNAFKDMPRFTLVYSHDDKYGPNKDIPVAVFKIQDDDDDGKVNTIRTELFKKLTSTIRAKNFCDVWSPHISKPVQGFPRTIHVTGIKSDDGKFFMKFPIEEKEVN